LRISDCARPPRLSEQARDPSASAEASRCRAWWRAGNADLKLRRQVSGVGGQTTEDRGRMTEIRGQKSEVGSQNVDFGMQIGVGMEYRARCGSEVSNEKVWIKVCNTYFPKQKGRVILNPAFSKIVNSSYALIINSLLEQCR
jgi:hypothetical protein